MAAILPKPGGANEFAQGQVFKSQKTISKLSKGSTLFRLYSEGPKPSHLAPRMPGPLSLSSTSATHGGAGASPQQADGDNQDSLFKLFTAPQSSFDAPASTEPAAAALQGPQPSVKASSDTADADDDSSNLPHTRQDVEAIKDLARLSDPVADPSATTDTLLSHLSTAPAATSHAAPRSSSLISAGQAMTSGPGALQLAPASGLRASDVADQGLFALWQNAGKGQEPSGTSPGSLDAADMQDGVTLAAAPAAAVAPATDYYGIPNGGAAVPI